MRSASSTLIDRTAETSSAFAFGHRRLGGAVHRRDEFVDALLLAGRFQQLGARPGSRAAGCAPSGCRGTRRCGRAARPRRCAALERRTDAAGGIALTDGRRQQRPGHSPSSRSRHNADVNSTPSHESSPMKSASPCCRRMSPRLAIGAAPMSELAAYGHSDARRTVGYTLLDGTAAAASTRCAARSCWSISGPRAARPASTRCRRSSRRTRSSSRAATKPWRSR